MLVLQHDQCFCRRVTQVDPWPLPTLKTLQCLFPLTSSGSTGFAKMVRSFPPSSPRPQPSTQHDDTYNQIQTRVFDPTGSETHVIARQADITSLL
jgi:hypothetical protein